ncbi:hypothetical protein [Natronolimnobius baerhuensis]|uniref:hypothetical protein n=1 Tax=Natronolimnobius baerhuensis TaxID=253108 RepID=UPI0015962C55|nr:hypothetical protein [Natronolimnobius baerhuensis]
MSDETRSTNVDIGHSVVDDVDNDEVDKDSENYTEETSDPATNNSSDTERWFDPAFH